MARQAVTNDAQIFRPAVVHSPWVVVLVVATVLLALLPTGMYVYYSVVQSRLSYRVSAAGLTVEMGVGRIHIPAGEVVAVGRLPGPERSRRAFGAGMRGLQMGWYDLDGQRVYRVTTAGRDLVYVDTRPDAATARPGTRYVLSPKDPDGFVALVQAARDGQWSSASGAAEEVFPPPLESRVVTDPLMLVSIALTLPIAVAFPWLLLSGARGMRYRVGPEGIAIHHLGRPMYRWSSIRSVQRLDGPLPRLIRVFGASLPGYHVGTFTAGPLGSVSVYATRLVPPLVLLETTTGKVILDPDDVDGFLEAVRRYR